MRSIIVSHGNPDSRRRHRALVGTTALFVTCLSACGNWISVNDAGQVGISVDSAGHPVVAVMTCGESTPVIDMAEVRGESRPDTEPNVQRGRWQARKAFAGVETFTLDDPGGNWVEVRSPGSLGADQGFVVDGGTLEDENASLGGVTFRLADLAGLSPDRVRVGESVESLSSFGAYRCH